MFDFNKSQIIIALLAVLLFAWIYFNMIHLYPIISILVLISVIITFIIVTKNDEPDL